MRARAHEFRELQMHQHSMEVRENFVEIKPVGDASLRTLPLLQTRAKSYLYTSRESLRRIRELGRIPRRFSV